jgi:hypothetical protein
MIILNESVWVVMSKDRSLVLKGDGIDRELVPVNTKNDVRLITYKSESIAKSAMKRTTFSGMDQIKEYKNAPESHYYHIADPYDYMKQIINPEYIPHDKYLEAVEITLTAEIIKKAPVTVETSNKIIKMHGCSAYNG